ncbi:retinal guanylyl cyclase 2-like [Chiloscyllium punctatum]|uniref:retinal guanylyl cyclase 2-like n=1 Tax=Chiloscyllium punctatum TaxID=137246 RepID=UPI003B6379C2
MAARSPTFTIGLVGPWRCDPVLSRALPELAAGLAIQTINWDPSVSPAYHYDYTVLDEECRTAQGLAGFARLEQHASGFVGPLNPGYCSAAGLLAKSWGKPLVSWACPDPDPGRSPPRRRESSHLAFIRPMPSAAAVLLRVLEHFGWARVAVVSSEQELWVETARALADGLRRRGLPVSLLLTAESRPQAQPEEAATHILNRIREMDGVRGRNRGVGVPWEVCRTV